MYKKMYHILFNAITDAIDKIEWEDYEGALARLEIGCQDAEEIYMTQAPELPEPSENTLPFPCCPLCSLQQGAEHYEIDLSCLDEAGL